MTIDSLAEELYETYSEAVGGKSFDGSPLPSWEIFKKDPEKIKQVRGWLAVAWKARHTVIVKTAATLMDDLGNFPG